MGLPWLSVFLMLFASGTLLAGATIPAAAIGARFHRFNVTTALLLAVLAAMASVRGPDARWLAAGYAGALLLYSMAVRVPGLGASRPLSLALAGWGAAAVFAGLREPSAALLVACPMSAATLGMALVAMMLGHSYLSSANLSFDLLADACRHLMGAIAARGILSAVWFLPQAEILSTWVETDLVLVLLVGVRYVVGIVCAFALAWMALACVKIRSNQSATGILYVVLGFVVMGELVAAYVMGEKSIGL